MEAELKAVIRSYFTGTTLAYNIAEKLYGVVTYDHYHFVNIIMSDADVKYHSGYDLDRLVDECYDKLIS